MHQNLKKAIQLEHEGRSSEALKEVENVEKSSKLGFEELLQVVKETSAH